MKFPRSSLLPRPRPLACSIAALLLATGLGRAQTYTFQGNATFTNPLVWNFGAGPVPASDAALALGMQSFGGALTASNDLNLTLQTLDLAGNGTLTLAGLLGGNLAFTGGSGAINFGSSASFTLAASTNVVLASGLSALTLDGAGPGALTLAGVVSSNTAAGAPLIVATDAGNAGTGIVTLGGANTFSGGVVLNSGTLQLGSNRALGDRANTLTVNGGSLRATAPFTIANAVTLNSTLNVNGSATLASPATLALAGVLSGAGGVTQSGAGLGAVLQLRGINPYTGATTVRALDHATRPGLDGYGASLHLTGAAASILLTSGIDVSAGGTFRLDYSDGHSVVNGRVSAGTGIGVTGGFLETIGTSGVVTQSLGTVTAGGLTTIAASTNGGGSADPGSATEVTIANLQRAAGGTVTFTGPNLGGAPVEAGVLAAQGNVLLTQVNGGAPSAALIGGGGGTGTANLSILPWALGDTTNAGNSAEAGAGFVTYGADGVRLLHPTAEYNNSNNFATLPNATQNMRIGGSVTAPGAPVTVNSIFVQFLGLTTGGANAITITSGALASNALTHTVSAPLIFGTGSAGEAIVSVVGPLDTLNEMTLSGQVTAGSLVKSGHGQLILSGSGNAIAGGITLNGGLLSVNAISRLGGATALTFHSPSQTLGATLAYTGAGADALSAPVVTNGGAAGFNVTSSTLTLNSNVSGAGSVRKDGEGALVLAGTNTYSGGTYLGGGALQFDSDARLGAAGGFLHVSTAGGSIVLAGPWVSGRSTSIEAGAGLQLGKGGNNATLAGPLSGEGGLRTVGAGTLAITGADNGYSGAIQIGNETTEGGTVALTGAGTLNGAGIAFGSTAAGAVGLYALDLSAATAASGTPWRSFSTLTTTGGFTQPHSVQLGAGIGAPVDVRVSGGIFGGTSGVIQGFGKLVKVGAANSTLTLTTANTFTGGVEVWGGTLGFVSDAALGDSANGLAIQGGVLNATADSTSSRAITLAPTPQSILRGALNVTLANGLGAAAGEALTLNGPIGGAGGFNKVNAGTVHLTGANSYAGDTQVSAGTLTFTGNASLGSASSRLRLNGGTLTHAGSTATVLPRTIVLTNNGTLDAGTLPGATLTVSGPLLGGSGVTLTKTGTNAATLTLSGDSSSFFGTLAIGDGANNTGSTLLTGSGQLRRATVTIAPSAGATFNLAGLTRELGGVNININNIVALGTGGRLTTGFNNGNMVWSGTVSGVGGTGVFTKTGTGNISLTSSGNSFGGGFHLLSGTGNTTTLSGAGTLNLQSAFTLGAWGSNANRGPLLVLSNVAANALDDGVTFGRIANAQAIHSNAGELQFTTTTSTAPGSLEIASSLRGAGMSTVTMTTGGTLNFADAVNGLTRLQGGTFLFRGGGVVTPMGSGAASTVVANLLFANLPGGQLIGGGGGTGASTISILPYAVGDTGLAGSGSNFVTYGANGIRVLNITTEVVNNVNVVALAGTTANNVRLANTLLTTSILAGGADRTINALNLAGTASRTRIESATTERLIVASGLVLSLATNVYATNAAGTAGIPLGIQVAELQTGAGNTRELNVFTTGGDLALGANVTTSGGLTKSGAATLYLTSTANTYTGATSVNAGTLNIDSLAALGGSTQLQLGGGFLKYRGGNATLAQSIVAAGGSGAGLGASAGFHVVSGTTLDAASASVSGHGGILKDGTGVLRLTGANTNSGATLIAAGALAIDGPAALGSNARVVFTDSAISAAGGQTLRFDAPMTLTQDFVVNSAQNGTGFGYDTNGNAVTLSGTLLDARGTGIRGLYKFGAGELNLTATEMYTGATQIFGGTLRLSGANGSILNSTGTGGFRAEGSVLVHPGGALVLDNSAANHNNRLPDVWDTPFGTGNTANGGLVLNGGELKIIGHAAGTSERINQIEIASATITLSGGGTMLTSGQVIRGSTSGSSAIFIRGTNLGALPGPGSTNFFVTDLGSGGVQLHGAGGAEGTPFVNILRGGMGDTSDTGAGTDLLTYASDTGFRTLTAGEYTSTIPANNFDLNRAPNVALAGAAAVNETTALTALKLSAGASLGGTGTALLAQSTVLATGNATISVPSFSTNLANAGPSAIFLTAGPATTLTVESVLPGAALGKYGAGTLLLNGRRIGSGATTLKQGTLTLGANGALNPLGALAIDPGATFDLGGSDRSIGSLTQDGGTIGTFHLGQISAGTVALGTHRLTLFDGTSTLFSGTITGTGGVTKTFLSSGTSTFTQPQSYSGSTILRGGTLQLAGAGSLASNLVEVRGGTLLFNNTDDNATSGYLANRLGTSTPITLAGGGITFTENANTPGNHQLGAVTLAGGGTLTITNGALAPSTVTVANLTRSAARGTLSVSATNLGLTQSPVGGARLFLTQIEGGAPAAALLGGGGGVGTTIQSILPWAYAGSALLTYGADGLRALTTSEYETNLLNAPTSPNVNSRTTGLQTLTAPRTVNALQAGGNVTGAHDLTLNSGALALGSSVNVGVASNALLTGAGNTRELVINATGSIAGIDYNLTTSGGVTKSGPGTLFLGGTNTFTGGLTISQGDVRFTTDSRLGAPGGAIRFGGSFGPGVSGLTYVGSANVPLVFTRPVETTGLGGFADSNGFHRWQLNGVSSGAGGIILHGSSNVFEIGAANTYAGPTLWTGGHIYLNGDSAFGSGGELLLASGGTHDLVLRNPWTSSRTIQATGASAVQTNGFDATWSGQFIGSGGLTKNGIGSLTFAEAMPYSGALTVAAGEVRLKDRGSLAADASTHTISAGAALTLDDTGVHHSDRLHDSSGTITLAGGTLNLLGSSSATTEEVFNNLTLSAGASTITLAPGSGQTAIVRLAGSVTNGGGAASLWRGSNLGVNAPGTANSANFLLTPTNVNAFPLIGGGAPAGHPSISIIRGGFGDTSATGSGTQFVTYDLEKGVRLLDPVTEFTTTAVDGSFVTDNVKVDGSALALANFTTVNALWLKDGGSITGAGELALLTGNLLVTGAGNTVAKPLVTGSNTLAIGGPGNVTFSTAISSGSFGGLIKTGAGTLTLSVANAYVGDTVLADGITAIGDALAFDVNALLFQGGEIRNVSGGPLAIANFVVLNGPMKVGGAQDFEFGGDVFVSNATREIQTTNTGMTTISGVVQNSQSLINYGLTKTGAGLLVLANPANTYDGPTMISAGVLSVGTLANGSVGTLLIPSGIGQSYSDADKLVLDGGTLRYTGGSVSTDRLFTLTPNGGAINASGSGNLTFSNTGSIAAPGSGLRTLTLTGNNSTSNTMAVSLTNGPTLSDATSLTVSTTQWTLTNANTFTGATTVSSGTLETAAANALGNTASVTVNTGGTLLLSSASEQVNNNAAFTLAGGTLRGNANGLDENVGTLTLSVNSVIDFGSFAAGLVLRFDDSSSLSWTGSTLNVWNWSAGLDRLYVGLNPSGLIGSQLSKINFYSDSGSTLASGFFGGAYKTIAPFDGLNGEVSPVPEPSSIFAAAGLLGLIGWRERRRERQSRSAQRAMRA